MAAVAQSDPDVERFGPSSRPLSSRWSLRWTDPLLVGFGLLCGTSALSGGYYDISVWGPGTLVLLVGLIACLLALPMDSLRRFALPLAGLAGLAVWAVLSGIWAESSDLALIEGDRWGLYAVAFALLAMLVRDRRDAGLLFGAATAGILIVAGDVLVRMLGSAGGDLFLGGRLNEPLGYVNALATAFLIGMWPLVALAEARRNALLSGLAVGGVTILASLAALSESRGAALAALGSILVMVVAVPGRQRRLWIFLVAGAGIVAISGTLVAVYHGAGRPADVRHAARLIVVTGACAAALWTIADSLIARIVARDATRLRAARAASLALLVAIGLGGAGVALASAGRISHRLRVQAHAFTHLDTSDTSTRFLSGAGNRYDYWRVAMHEFRSGPVRGLGAGNFDVDYFRQRRTAEDVRQPHSIELQTLAELGVVGGVLLLLFLLSPLVGLVRLRAVARDDVIVRALAIAGGGAFVTWLLHTSVDWMHLMPGLTGLALAGAVILTRSWAPVTSPAAARRRLPVLVIAVVFPLLILLAIDVARPTVASHLRSQAGHELARDPIDALRKANSALAIDDGSLDSSYLKSAALARLDRYGDARHTLLSAARSHPSAWVPWALLGDLATRRGDRPAARAAYRHALRLNPRDPGLLALAN